MVKELAVARFRAALHPVQRRKHVLDFQTAIPVNLQLTQVIATVVDNPALANTAQVNVGSHIYGVFCSVEAVCSETSTTATPNMYFMLYKDPGDNLTMPNANTVGADDNKRYVLHQEMVMLNALDGGSPRSVFKGVVKIPKGLSRMGPGDAIKVQLFIPSTGVAVNSCAQYHYKEFQ